MFEDPRSLTLSPAVIESLSQQGYSQTEISELFNVSRQHISKFRKQYGPPKADSPRQLANKEFPFKVPADQKRASAHMRLRDHGEYYYTHGVGMADYKLYKLKGFYKKLKNQVVEFDPNIPPEPRVSQYGGWAFRPRLPKDEDLLIRVNEHAHITEEGLKIWRLPDKEP